MMKGTYRVVWVSLSGNMNTAFAEAEDKTHALRIIELHYGRLIREVVRITKIKF